MNKCPNCGHEVKCQICDTPMMVDLGDRSVPIDQWLDEAFARVEGSRRILSEEDVNALLRAYGDPGDFPDADDTASLQPINNNGEET